MLRCLWRRLCDLPNRAVRAQQLRQFYPLQIGADGAPGRGRSTHGIEAARPQPRRRRAPAGRGEPRRSTERDGHQVARALLVDLPVGPLPPATIADLTLPQDPFIFGQEASAGSTAGAGRTRSAAAPATMFSTATSTTTPSSATPAMVSSSSSMWCLMSSFRTFAFAANSFAALSDCAVCD